MHQMPYAGEENDKRLRLYHEMIQLKELDEQLPWKYLFFYGN